jgi:hypothetical protein
MAVPQDLTRRLPGRASHPPESRALLLSIIRVLLTSVIYPDNNAQMTR